MKVRIRRIRPAEISIPITTEYIKLESFLKLADAAPSGGMAKTFIQDGAVTVNGEVCTQGGKKLYPGDEVSLGGETVKVAARAE